MAKKLRERFILTRVYKDERNSRVGFTIFGILIIALAFDLIYLNILSLNKTSIILTQQKSNPSVTVTPTAIQTPTSAPAVQMYQPQNSSQPQASEYFIALGSGTSESGDWEDVPGLEASVDFGKYPNIKEIRFEASVSVPTANEAVSVRLFNKTDQHPVWNSEITMDGGASSYLVSSPLIYDKGAKTYGVQMKTQLKFAANLTQSRIHIVSN